MMFKGDLARRKDVGSAPTHAVQGNASLLRAVTIKRFLMTSSAFANYQVAEKL
jgi:hypothetical protein